MFVKMEGSTDVDVVCLKTKSKKEFYDMISGPDGVYLP